MGSEMCIRDRVVRIDPRDVASVRLVGSAPGDVLEADLPQRAGWQD